MHRVSPAIIAISSMLSVEPSPIQTMYDEPPPPFQSRSKGRKYRKHYTTKPAPSPKETLRKQRKAERQRRKAGRR